MALITVLFNILKFLLEFKSCSDKRLKRGDGLALLSVLNTVEIMKIIKNLFIFLKNKSNNNINPRLYTFKIGNYLKIISIICFK